MEVSGGRPKKETTGFEKEKTTGLKNKKPLVIFKKNPMNNENENVNVNANANENEIATDDSCVDGLHASDSCVDGLQKAIEFYNNNIGLLTPFGLETIEEYSKEMPEDLIILAMKKAVEADKRTIQYIKGILNNWQKKRIKTVLDAEKETKQFKTKNEKNKNAHKPDQRDYSDFNFGDLYANRKEVENE